MPKSISAISAVLLIFVFASTGCGSNSSASSNKIVRIPFASPSIVGTSLPARYTCDGKDIFPTLEWGRVPVGVHQLAVFVLGLTPNNTSGGSSISVEWAAAGINPALHKLTAGQLPKEVRLGIGTHGKTRYSICPKKGTSERYQFGLYAIPDTVQVPPSFIGLQLLGGIASVNAPDPTTAGGEFTVSYRLKK